jgi:hypothetical protein
VLEPYRRLLTCPGVPHLIAAALLTRLPELFRLYTGMNTSMDELMTDYTVDQLEAIADFLRRTAEAGKSATDKLANP